MIYIVKMKRYYVDQKVLLRKNLLLGQVVRILPNGNLLVSFYENNIFKYEVVTDDAEIVEEKEYEVIRHRINTINKLLGD